MVKLKHFFGIFRSSDHELARSFNPHDDKYVFDLKIGPDHTWKAGEHGAFSIPGKKIRGKGFRAFSVASIPDEGFMRIATRIPDKHSDYKEVLKNLQPGDEIKVRGPFGWFVLRDDHTPVVMIAGGIGITPVRAIFKELEKGNERKVKLIYSERDRHLFRDELLDIASRDPRIEVVLTSGREETSTEIKRTAGAFGKDAYYYVSGSQKLIKGVKKELKALSIPSGKIVKDPFFGY